MPFRVDRALSVAHAIDAYLLAAPARARYLVLAFTVITMAYVGLPHVPRPYVDYSRIALLRTIEQKPTYGPDTISDMYGARVTRNNVRDMYTKREIDQTPLEAATWTKEASAPYPPVVLLATAGLSALGASSGVGFYGMILGLACLFLTLSLVYFLKTRWYLFPVLYLNFFYFGYRFVYVQDGTYLMMLVVIITALFLARRRHEAAHLLMAVAITMKLSPLYYAKSVLGMKAWTAALFIAIIAAGLVLPWFILENYLYIYRFHSEIKGQHWSGVVGALCLVAPFSALLWYVETRLHFDMEDRIGWGLVPFAMLIAMNMNAARHLLIVLLVPDKRAARNLAAAFALGLHTVFPSLIRFGSVVYIASGLLTIALVYYLHQIGWQTVRDDFRHPGRTARLMLARG